MRIEIRVFYWLHYLYYLSLLIKEGETLSAGARNFVVDHVLHSTREQFNDEIYLVFGVVKAILVAAKLSNLYKHFAELQWNLSMLILKLWNKRSGLIFIDFCFVLCAFYRFFVHMCILTELRQNWQTALSSYGRTLMTQWSHWNARCELSLGLRKLKYYKTIGSSLARVHRVDALGSLLFTREAIASRDS